MTGDLLAAALGYAARGCPVFPTRPNRPGCPTPVKCKVCKSPLIPKAHPKDHPCRGECGGDGHGCLDATTDLARICAWWSRWPTANIGIGCGYPGPDVLDVDNKPEGSGFAALNILKRAGLLRGAQALVRTPSGGVHVWFAGSAQTNHSLPRQFLDFRSRAGYVLAPPSVVHGKPYELLEHRPGTAQLDWDAVKRALDPPRARRVFRRPEPWTGEGVPPGVQRALEADATDRSAALHRLVGACVRAGLDEQSIHQLAAQYQPAVDKYGDRLAGEVDRSMRRIGA